MNNEVHSVELGQLLQSDTYLIIDDILFCLTRLFVGYSFPYLSGNMSNTSDQDISQLIKRPRLTAGKLLFAELLEPTDIADAVR